LINSSRTRSSMASACAHLAGEDDELAAVAPLRALTGDFAAFLAVPPTRR
jgi:hypothetical protein